MVKLADTLQAMSDFPVAMASGINIVKEDDTEKDLQQMYEDGELGGESMPMPLSANMLLVSENDETSGDLIWSQIDKSEVGSVPLICTEEEWEELDPKPVEGTEVIITDDEDGASDSNNMYIETHTITVTTANWTPYLCYADFNITLEKPLKNVANTKIFMQVMDSDLQVGGHCIKNFTENTVAGRIISGYSSPRAETFDVVLLIVAV